MVPNRQRVSTDDDDALKVVGAGDDCEAADGLIGAGALSLRDDVGVGNACAYEVLLANAAFGVLIAAVSAEVDDQGSDSAVVE